VSLSRAIIFIDTETGLEGPWRGSTDVAGTLPPIAATLGRLRVPAVFNVCGSLLAGTAPLWRDLSQSGHEIALHGWAHENLRLLDDRSLEEALRRSHDGYLVALKQPPAGFRAPWLEYDARLIAWLAAHGYRWTSHRHLPFRERFLTPALRPELRGGRFPGAAWAAIQEWRFTGAPVRLAGTMWDIPLTSSMDGELLGLVSPLQDSPADVISFCRDAWLTQATRHRQCFTLNVHDWLVGTGNRPELLSRTIASLQDRGFAFTTATDYLKSNHAVAG